MEEGPPPTIIEVNSAEYTEQTESVSHAGGGDVPSSRCSPSGAFYKIPNPMGRFERATEYTKADKVLVEDCQGSGRFESIAEKGRDNQSEADEQFETNFVHKRESNDRTKTVKATPKSHLVEQYKYFCAYPIEEDGWSGSHTN